jgi:hypothetical protein
MPGIQTDKPCEDMDFNEFHKWATHYLCDQLIQKGFMGISEGVYMIMEQMLSNKVFGRCPKKKDKK